LRAPRAPHPFPTRRSSDLGNFTVAFAGCTNAAAFGPLAPSDAAGPVFVSMSDGGGVDGKPEPGDTLDLRFSEPLSPTWGPSTTRSEEHTSELQSPDHLVCR